MKLKFKLNHFGLLSLSRGENWRDLEDLPHSLAHTHTHARTFSFSLKLQQQHMPMSVNGFLRVHGHEFGFK